MLVIGSDHAGFPLKQQLLPILEELKIETLDVGCFSADSVDYTDIADAVVGEVLSGHCDRGILICGTGIGISIAANRHRGIRCGLCSEPYSARMTRAHNDANVLAMGARVVGIGLAIEILEVFLNTPFEGGRHAQRLAKLDEGDETP